MEKTADIELSVAQRKAITSLEGPLFVGAGAGSGKTGVVTRRFVHAVATGWATVDQILTITFTKKAASEMMERIRGLLHVRWTIDGGPADEEQCAWMAEAYRRIEQAQISTIDSFCASVLRAHALAAGIDPNFGALDEPRAQLIKEEAFDICLKRFVERHKEAATKLISAYDPGLAGDLFKAIAGAYDQLRSQGHEPTLPLPQSKLAKAEEELREAIEAVRAAVKAIDSPTDTQLSGLEQVAILEAALHESDDLARYEMATGAKLKKKGSYTRASEEFGRLAEARDFFLNEIRSLHAMGTLKLLKDLLETFAERYEIEKHRRGVLDFGDLSIKARDLLRDDKNVRQAISSRYRLVMVDEFQDTNELQHEIVRLVANNNLCLVGDENQSIYRFRDAVVELFQEQKAEAEKGGYLVELLKNYRSQPEILAFVDHMFNREGMLRPGYLQLTPSAKPDGRREDQRVEIVFVDTCRDSSKDGLKKVPTQITAKAEARLIAERLKQLAQAGYEVGGMAVLVRKARQADIYRDALAGVGIESYLAMGRSYFQKLELGDVVNILKLLINPLDDLVLIGALRSPMAGLSDDALYWLRQAARSATGGSLPIWSAIAGGGGVEGLSDKEQAKLGLFVSELKQLRERSRREGLSAISRRAIDFNDFAATVASCPGGKLKLANLMKLLDMAADFEESWGNDLPAFTDFLEKQKQVEAKEAEAPTEEEGVNAVRFLTMHGAKGLEFPLVVLPDLGAGGGGRDKVILVDRHGLRVGIKYRANSPFDGNAFEYDRLEEENRRADLREEKRLGYVAMTRAKDHLLLSGMAPADLPPTEKKSEPPFDWLRTHLPLCWPRDEIPGGVECLEDIKGVKVAAHVCAEAEVLAESFDRAAGEVKEKPIEPVSPDIIRMPPAAVYIPATISPTAIDTYTACPRRYFLENVLRARDVFGENGGASASTTQALGEGGNGLTPQQIGTLVHALLERAGHPLADVTGLTDEYLEKVAAAVLPAGIRLTADDRRKAACLVANLANTKVIDELNQAASKGILSRELNFSTMVDKTILKGQIDALIEKDAGSLVVDYKTGAHGEEHPVQEAAAGYENQMTAYALAAARMKHGPVEVVLVFLDDPVEEIHTVFGEDQLCGLEEKLKERLKAMEDGRFQPLVKFDQFSCSQCAGNLQTPLCPTAAAARSKCLRG